MIRRYWWGMVAAAVFAQAHAVEPHAPSEAEFNSLPPYCAAKLKSRIGSADYASWEKILGKDFVHTHHYCFALNYINRYYRSRSRQDKTFNLQSALNNLDYMVTHAAPGYSLMPEIYQNRGLVYSLMGRNGEAVRDMRKAIELNPRQVKAYNVLADFYSGSKQANKALETVTEGLRHNPGTRSLQRRYTELGGKLPYPEPVQAMPEAAPPEGAAGDVVATPPIEAATAASRDEPAAAASGQVPAPAIGSPSNPYCRFCPD